MEFGSAINHKPSGIPFKVDRRCIRCHVGEVHQRSTKDPNVCLWCRLGEKLETKP